MAMKPPPRWHPSCGQRPPSCAAWSLSLANSDPPCCARCPPDPCYNRYTEFSVEGGATIYLTGYYMPEFEAGEHGRGGNKGRAAPMTV